jgi:hypothetical protein
MELLVEASSPIDNSFNSISPSFSDVLIIGLPEIDEIICLGKLIPHTQA